MTERVHRPHRPLTNWHDRHAQSLTVGERAADWLRNHMGSWGFIFGFCGVMLGWALLNTTAQALDPFPYIFLNLMLSMLAGMQGAILLIAARRQDEIAAALAQHDFETNRAAKFEIEELARINAEQLAILRRLEHSGVVLDTRGEPAARHAQGSDPQENGGGQRD
ncbi:DUF1003 domain-containing protein [Microbacterium sp. SL62]|uniref:DUF1003 domain-containing protein n=1 Tax=Microbacterium sp. SL62 TaxID=2995139 RepID=UPI002DD4271A|nr:DUF1003 domain-containing protein [Microbacterium sp. SL62]